MHACTDPKCKLYHHRVHVDPIQYDRQQHERTEKIAKKMEIVPPYYTRPVRNPVHSTFVIINLEGNKTETIEFTALCQRLEKELWSAKRGLLSCSNILMPAYLLQRIARDVLEMAKDEPSGLRGCLLLMYIKGENDYREICTIPCDPRRAQMFKLCIVLKQNTKQIYKNRWSFIPVFIKNLIKGVTVVIDHEFIIEKEKLY